MIGLSLSQTLEDLALLYLASVQALAVSLICFMFQMTSSQLQSDILGRKGLYLCRRNPIPLVSSSLVSARHASYSGGHERSRTWHQDPLPVRRVEQKCSVCTDSRQRYRYKVLTRNDDSFDVNSKLAKETFLHIHKHTFIAFFQHHHFQGCLWCCQTRWRLC